MCDTLGFTENGRTIFAKNSDRSPNEVQVLEYRDALLHFDNDVFITYEDKKPVTHTQKAMQKTTYAEVEQVTESHAVFLSRPKWMWGAEMGVNDCGVCIGNEAVFTKGQYSREGLTGMDLLRLALERSDSAAVALHTIINNLEKYGQGGNCGYDHEFFYNNSFLIADAEEIYILDTFRKEWAWKKVERAAISNALSLGSDADKYSGERCDFAAKHSDPLFTFGARADKRRKTTAKALETAKNVSDMMTALRAHNTDAPFAKGSVAGPCMHFGGLVGDHTTSSMAADITKERTLLWLTGSSCPCVSLFKPWLFSDKPVCPVFADNDRRSEEYWRKSENFRRSLIGKVLPGEYYQELNEIQSRWITLAESCSGKADFYELSENCAEEEKEFFAKWGAYDFPSVFCDPVFKRNWKKKNEVFAKESADFFGDE